jgi:hypothetical protein
MPDPKDDPKSSGWRAYIFARDQWHCRICGDRFLYSEMVRKHIANEHNETMPPSMSTSTAQFGSERNSHEASSLRGQNLLRGGRNGDRRPLRFGAPFCRNSAAEQRDEVAATYVDCHVPLPWEGLPMQWRDDITF